VLCNGGEGGVGLSKLSVVASKRAGEEDVRQRHLHAAAELTDSPFLSYD